MVKRRWRRWWRILIIVRLVLIRTTTSASLQQPRPPIPHRPAAPLAVTAAAPPRRRLATNIRRRRSNNNNNILIIAVAAGVASGGKEGRWALRPMASPPESTNNIFSSGLPSVWFDGRPANGVIMRSRKMSQSTTKDSLFEGKQSLRFNCRFSDVSAARVFRWNNRRCIYIHSCSFPYMLYIKREREFTHTQILNGHLTLISRALIMRLVS